MIRVRRLPIVRAASGSGRGRLRPCSIAIAGLAAASLALQMAAQDTGPRAREAATRALGMNLTEINHYTPQWVFVDACKQAKPWHIVKNHPDEEAPALSLTDDGYPILPPGRQAATLIYRDCGGHYPGGEYSCSYRGRGRIVFQGDARVVAAQPGTLTVDVRPTNTGIILRIEESDPESPVRDIRLIMPGFEESWFEQPFHPLFLERLAGFRVLRFMDWMRTNNSTVSRWEETGETRDFTQDSPSGVAPEYIARLCNTLGADPWVCIPHRATDGYVRGLAALLRRELNPQRTIYIEYSNEVWNTAFEQGRWIREQARERGIEWPQAYVRRSIDIFAIFADVFGSSERLVRVIGSQHANTWLGDQIVRAIPEGPRTVDALAVAPYFGGGVRISGLDAESVLDRAEAEIDARRRLTDEYVRLARVRALQLIAYEGGQHLTLEGRDQGNPGLVEHLAAINRHERMEQLYLKDMRGWFEAGGGLFVAFSSVYPPRRWGAWGVLEHQDQPAADAPKFRAVQALLRELRPMAVVEP